MCGIVGYIGTRDATPIILNGLKRLNTAGMIRLESLSSTATSSKSEKTRASYPN